MPEYKVGQRVILRADEELQVSEQRATIVGPLENGVYTVRINLADRAADDLDGLCEVPSDQIRLA